MVRYDDGDEEMLDLASEHIEILPSGTRNSSSHTNLFCRQAITRPSERFQTFTNKFSFLFRLSLSAGSSGTAGTGTGTGTGTEAEAG